jgi:hypothetical protein
MINDYLNGVRLPESDIQCGSTPSATDSTP